MNYNFFKKQTSLFNYISFILVFYYHFNLINTHCSIIYKKNFQNDEFDEHDENKTDDDEVTENLDENEGFTVGVTV